MPAYRRPRLWIAMAISLLHVAVSQACLAQTAPESGGGGFSDHQRHLLEDAELNDVAFVDAHHGWVVGARGAIWHTTDGGRTWRPQHSGVDCVLQSVTFIDQHTGWAVGGTTAPYSQRSNGVVLRTLDGGRRWTQMTGSMLPGLKRARFFSPTRGWAVGSPSPLFGSGLFRTSDGGRSWTPVDAPDEHWLCGDFRDAASGAIAGRMGQLNVVMTRGAIKSRTPGLGLRSIRDLRLAEDVGGWLVGDGGLLMTTGDGGLTWQLPPRAIPPVARNEINFTAVATVGQSVWAVGAPGSLVLHSPDGGHRWHVQRTGQSLPLKAITFIDEHRGWAVGAMGTILHTADGGRSWQRQRSGGTRAALLCIVADGRDLPLDLLARLGGDEGYLCVGHVIGRRDVEDRQGYAASQEDLTIDAVIDAGASAASQSWQFPLRGRELALSPDHVVRHWNQTHDGRAMSVLQRDLVRVLRTWRPDVVVTHGERADAAESQIVGQLVGTAVKAAADTTLYPEQLTHADLQPWQVKKTFTICAAKEAGDVSVSAAALALRLGTSVSEYTAAARGRLHDDVSPAPSLIEFRLESHHVEQSVARRDFFSGLSLHPGGEARRRVGDLPAGNINALRKLVQRRRNVEQMIAQTHTVAVDDDAWLGQVNEMTRGLNSPSAARLVYQLARRYSESGRSDLAAETYQILAERYRDEPLADRAMEWLILHYTSAEAAWRRRDLADPAAQPARFALPGDEQQQGQVVPISFDDPEPPPAASGSHSPRPPRQFGRAIALYQLLQRTNPVLAAEPRLLLAVAAAQRSLDDPRVSEATYRQIAGSPSSSSLTACAQTELWLRDPKSPRPKSMSHCHRTKEKPFLDGKLDDFVWRSAKPALLTAAEGDAVSPASLWLACDEQFLYLGVECAKVEGIDYAARRRAANQGRGFAGARSRRAVAGRQSRIGTPPIASCSTIADGLGTPSILTAVGILRCTSPQPSMIKPGALKPPFHWKNSAPWGRSHATSGRSERSGLCPALATNRGRYGQRYSRRLIAVCCYSTRRSHAG